MRDGIKAQSRRGTFADNWWSSRWISCVENSRIGARLDRGKNYARRGQVAEVNVSPGQISAVVQGSRVQPYQVTIQMQVLSDQQRQVIGEALSSSAQYSAQLLAGHLPQDIEEVFEACGLSLFPPTIQTRCSCPDWSNPCKHIVAVFYIIGEELDRDPLLWLQLRGICKQDLDDLLNLDQTPDVDPEPLPTCWEEFWGRPQMRRNEPTEQQEPSSGAVLPRQLGKFPLWRGDKDLWATLDDIYKRVRDQAEKIQATDDSDG